MEALAEPDEAFLTEHTARLVENDFRLRDLGLVEVKGASEPVGVFALEGRRRRTAAGGSAPLVGRAEELAALEAALARAQEGQAQVVGVVGEAGVGKSRLCEEFTRSAAARGITVRRAAGVSHAQDVPLLPVLDLFRDYFGIADADSRSEAQAKIAGRLLDLDPGLEDALPMLFDFLGVPDERHPAPRLSPEARMRKSSPCCAASPSGAALGRRSSSCSRTSNGSTLRARPSSSGSSPRFRARVPWC
jgi:hypothetical protein